MRCTVLGASLRGVPRCSNPLWQRITVTTGTQTFLILQQS